MATTAILDTTDTLVAQNDLVRFSVEGYLWRVTKVLPFENRVYVTSEIGKKQAVAAISSIVSIKRDLTFIPEEDHSFEYSDNWENDDDE